MNATIPQRSVRPHQPLDHGTISRLFELHGDAVHRFCVRVLGCEQDAADATQDAFLNLARRRTDVAEDADSLRFYLFATARNACFDLRRRARGDVSLDGLREAGAHVEEASRAADEQPEQHLLDSVARARVFAALAELPERQRAAWVLREVADLSYDEIGARLDVNANAVAQLLHRARRALQRTLVATDPA